MSLDKINPIKVVERGIAMRTYEEYRRILELWERGYPKKLIAKVSGIPRTSVTECIQRYGSIQALEESLIYPVEVLRGLYHSDGSRFSNIVNGTDYPRCQFTNNSRDICNLFTKVCDLLGLYWTTKTRRSTARDHAADVFISKRADVAYLDSVIGPKN